MHEWSDILLLVQSAGFSVGTKKVKWEVKKRNFPFTTFCITMVTAYVCAFGKGTFYIFGHGKKWA